MVDVAFRPIESKDLSYINMVRNSCRHFLHNDKFLELHETIRWFVHKQPQWYLLTVGDIKEGIPISETKIGYIRAEKHGTGLQIGMDLEEPWRGKGLAKKAYTQFISWAFEQGYHYLTLDVLASNTRAYTLYRSLGFKVNYDSHPIEIERGREKILTITMDLYPKDWNGQS